MRNYQFNFLTPHMRKYDVSVFRNRDNLLLRAFAAIGLTIMNLIDSINECIITEYDGLDGI